MRTILPHAVGLLCAYMVAWTASFIFFFVSNGEVVPWELYGRYLVLAWSFDGLEMVAFVWFGSLLGFVPLAALVELALWRVRRSGRRVI